MRAQPTQEAAMLWTLYLPLFFFIWIVRYLYIHSNKTENEQSPTPLYSSHKLCAYSVGTPSFIRIPITQFPQFQCSSTLFGQCLHSRATNNFPSAFPSSSPAIDYEKTRTCNCAIFPRPSPTLVSAPTMYSYYQPLARFYKQTCRHLIWSSVCSCHLAGMQRYGVRERLT